MYDAQYAYLFDVFVSVNIAFQMHVYIFYKTTDGTLYNAPHL